MEELLRLSLGIAVFVLMLGVGMDCTPRDIRRSAIRPSLLATVTAIQFLCIPAIVLGTTWILGLSPLLTTALLLVSACPSGTISNGYTFLSRGNSSLSVTFTTVSNLVAFVATLAAT